MKLLTKEIERALPPLYSGQGTPPAETMLLAKWFHPWRRWTWYASEGEAGEGTWLFFGLVIGPESEWGYFTLADLESCVTLGQGVERDLYFSPTRAGEILARHER